MTDGPVLELPDPAVVVLVGASGAGKSTFAARWFQPGEILSSDALRAHIAGDAADQRATRPAFTVLHRALVRRLAQRKLTVIDATNVQRHARRAIVRRAVLAGIPAVAIVFDLAPALVLARNTLRPGRVVPTAVVVDQLRDLQDGLAGGLEPDGFAAITILRAPDEVDALVVRRLKAATPWHAEDEGSEAPDPQPPPDGGAAPGT